MFQKVEAPRFYDSRNTKVVRLSALRTGRLYPPGNIPGTHFYQRLSLHQGHSAAGRIVPMKNSNDTIGNRTRDLPACSSMPQPSAPSRAPTPIRTATKCLIHCVILGFRRNVNDICSLSGIYAGYLVVPYQRFGTT